MNCLGLIGNVSDALLGQYADTINAEVRKDRGGRHSAALRVACVNSAKLAPLLDSANPAALDDCLIAHGRELRRAGAEALVLCGGMLHPGVPTLRRMLALPVIDMGPAVAARLREHQHDRVAILGTRTPREQQWWKDSLCDFGLLWPASTEAAWLDERMAEAHAGHPPDVEWKLGTRRIVAGLRDRGATAAVLAAPAIGRWLSPDDILIDLYDAAVIHAWAAARWALESDKLSAPPCLLPG